MRMGLAGTDVTPLFDGQSKYEVPVRLAAAGRTRGQTGRIAATRRSRAAAARWCRYREVVTPVRPSATRRVYHKDLLPVVYVVGDQAGRIDSPLYGMFAARGEAAGDAQAAELGEYFIRQPADPYREYALKWDGEWQVTYETFRDMGLAYAVGLILIYLLVVAQFGSYVVPLVIMAPIPLTVIGVMPGHALLGAQLHRDVDDRDDRARRHHRAQLDPAGRLHQPQGGRGRRLSPTR